MNPIGLSTNSNHRDPTLVLGGGFGGMAAALRLRALGHRVLLLERGQTLGGRGRGLEFEGFRQDAGPTVITAPHLLEELFALHGRSLADAIELRQLDTFYSFHYADGSRFAYGGDGARIAEAVEALSPGEGAGYRRLLAHAGRIFDIAFGRLADQPFHSPFPLLREIPALLRLGAPRSVHGAVSRYLRDERLRRAFSIAPLLVGGHPHQTTSIYLLIHYLEQRWGVHYPIGGVGALVSALTRLLIDSGVEVVTGATVTRVLDDGRRRVRGVRLADGREIPSRCVVSDLDPLYLYARMLEPGRMGGFSRLRLRHPSLSMGLFLLYFGVRDRYPEVEQHSILFGERFRQPLDDIFRKGRLPDDFSIYLHRPTATDPSMAPAGQDSFYALVPVPNLTAAIDWREAGPALRESVLRRLEQRLLPGLRQRLVWDRSVTPVDFAEDLLAHQGTGFSLAPRFHQSAWFRFHNRSPHLQGLYLVGAGTHPGAGIPGVLSSAKVVERLLRETPDAR